jgi:hypothetical protein
LIVFALEGDSTMTRFFFFRPATADFFISTTSQPLIKPAVVFAFEPATIPILGTSATHPYYTYSSSVKSRGGSHALHRSAQVEE